ncbi:MAG TPA: ROK family protein [bacterium]|nr:ROK family protein [bacterium]HRU32754.1 ROK family protein [bacterium]
MKKLRGRSLPQVRRFNRSLVLQTIRAHSPISRIELTELTTLTPTTITSLVDEFIKYGLVKEIGNIKGGVGRSRTLISINSEAYYVLGIDLARISISAGIVDLAGNLLTVKRVSSDLNQHFPVTLNTLEETIHSLLDEISPQIKEKIIAIGIGSPGPLSPSKGVIISPPNFTGWSNIPLKEIMEREFGLPTFIENDAKACALGERWFGCCKNTDNFVYLAVGTGVGAGIIIDGDIYRGEGELAGEIGHTTIDINGPRCSCGNYGCLEIYTSVISLIDRIEKEEGLKSLIRDGHIETLSSFYRSAREGNIRAVEILNDYCFWVGVGVVNIINTLSPSAVVLGREALINGSDLIIPRVEKVVTERSFFTTSQQTRILASSIGQDTGVIGAATIALQEFYKSPYEMIKNKNK